MPRLRCHYVDCVFLDSGYCTAAAAEIDPEEGCLTYAPAGEISPDVAWQENEEMEREWEEAGFDDLGEDDEMWLDVGEEEDMELPEDLDLDDDEDET